MVTLNSSLFTGLSGVRTAQVGLNVSGNNIANVNTKNYTRQVADTRISGLGSGGLGLVVGGGSTVAGINGLRSSIADQLLTREEGRHGFQDTFASGMAEVEGLLAETEFSGIRASMGQFFDSLEEATLRPADSGARREVLELGDRLATEIRQRDNDLFQFQSRTNLEVEEVVTRINQLTAEIESLGNGIFRSGNPPQDIVDERYRKINELSTLVAIDVYDMGDSRIQVNIKDSNFVLVGEDQYELSIALNGANNNFYDVQLDNGGATPVDITAEINGGMLGAKLELRDTELAGLRRRLDKFAAGFISQFNAVHTAGFTLSAAPNDTGLQFFDPLDPTAGGAPAPPAVDPDRYAGAASSIALSTQLLVDPLDPDQGFDPNKLALSDTAGETGNNVVALQMAALRTAAVVIDDVGDGTADTGTFERYYSDTMSTFGRTTRNAQDKLEGQQLLLDQAQARRDEVSAVNLDEEAVQLTQYQRAFQASSRFIGVINQLTADIINRLG
ncbi:flagellar hook-associated protein FlgK [Acanthopleuribacter pedis]|uniref:Flagellar hook-associated protein 1 n=1 Tax=Acanthopleuribacter pedis TaxID=442870 RepID=A0A8J7QEV9_9BACT|nr:flagellar hook-associated protein FlgK [Acanthopleuribacter pedis]MBO1317095.1 flagellar hook-associated protein FlgK [Acanthopleuribacter pedis]